MNVHKNARLTPSGRVLLVQRIEQGWRPSRAATAAGVSVRTAYRWLLRYRSGDRQLHDHSSAPHHCPHRLAPQSIAAIEHLRRQRQTGPVIAQALGLARSSVGLVLRRLRLNRLDRLEPKPVPIRYERERPGELLHLDIKTLGRFDRIGHRITGTMVGHNKGRGVGWEHLHVAIDDASRLAYTEVMPSLGKEDATAFLKRALGWFERLGVRVERVMTDNGSAYSSKLFANAIQTAGVRHIRTRPYRPQTNGKAERFIQTSLREWAYAQPYQTSEHRKQAVGKRCPPPTFRPFVSREIPHGLMSVREFLHGRSIGASHK